ncbi:MAG: Nif3-like dinuclear metal center hexameric protein, partial [Desulfuromonadales bacterium]|nr:Nif3-like dinuclear metal center hexameric protein [Desulfuromonadales bacterium]
LPLSAGDGNLVKLVVFVPAGYEETVAAALFQAGAGQIGNYDCCAFRSPGTGTFRPSEQARPFIGQQGVIERAHEVRLETIVPQERLARVVDKMLKAHPYEEVAYDLLPLANRRPGVGLGRIGNLAEPLTLEAFAGQVKQALGGGGMRLVGDLGARVAKIAVCGGSGASLLPEAARQGADVLVTGDLKYHEARQAQSLKIAVIDAGHFATERLAVPRLAQALRAEAARRPLAIEFIEMEGEADPFQTV